jgi:hypothetical protein
MRTVQARTWKRSIEVRENNVPRTSCIRSDLDKQGSGFPRFFRPPTRRFDAADASPLVSTSQHQRQAVRGDVGQIDVG